MRAAQHILHRLPVCEGDKRIEPRQRYRYAATSSAAQAQTYNLSKAYIDRLHIKIESRGLATRPRRARIPVRRRRECGGGLDPPLAERRGRGEEGGANAHD